MKFEKNPKKGWRLFYKARLTELDKILRSIVTNQSPLSDVVTGANPELTGKVFLTASGSAEIKGCPADGAPAFLKSSEYYKFVVNTFASNGSIYFPFNENGSAVMAGLSDGFSGYHLTVGGVSYHKDYILWRSGHSGISLAEFEFSECPMLDLLHLDGDDEKSFSRLVKSAFPGVTAWHDFGASSFDLSVGTARVPVVYLKAIKDEKMRIDLLAVLRAQELIKNNAVKLVSRYSPVLIRGLFLIPDEVSVEQMPMMFLK